MCVAVFAPSLNTLSISEAKSLLTLRRHGVVKEPDNVVGLSVLFSLLAGLLKTEYLEIITLTINAIGGYFVLSVHSNSFAGGCSVNNGPYLNQSKVVFKSSCTVLNGNNNNKRLFCNYFGTTQAALLSCKKLLLRCTNTNCAVLSQKPTNILVKPNGIYNKLSAVQNQ